MDKFVLKIWISRKASFLISILSGVRDIFLPVCPQVFFQLNVRYSYISERHESPIRRAESDIYIYIYVYINMQKVRTKSSNIKINKLQNIIVLSNTT